MQIILSNHIPYGIVINKMDKWILNTMSAELIESAKSEENKIIKFSKIIFLYIV